MIHLQQAECLGWLTVAQTEQRLADVAERFQGGSTHVSVVHVIGMLVLVGAIGAGLFLVARRMALRDGRSYFSTKRLFRELCQLHELDWPSRRLLWRLARAHDSKHPARLFLEPTWFTGTEVPAPLRTDAQQLADLHQRLFESQEA